MTEKKSCYLDHNATTPVRPEVVDAMLPYLREQFGNPNSPYFLGQRARKAVEEARERVAALVGAADPSEIVFTSCGSESDVAAIAGAAWQAHAESHGKRNLIVSSRIEHDAVRGILGVMRLRGFTAEMVGVDKDGMVDSKSVEALLGDKTAVVSIMHANNEVGTIQPIESLAAKCRSMGVLMHTDAVQSAGKISVDARKLGVDLLALSGHKINAPKGVGALYVRKGTRLVPTITGHQEKNRRGGTENVASIVGLGVACELARKELGHAEELRSLRDKLEAGVLKIKGVRRNGHPTKRLPNATHFSFEGLDGHHLVVALDMEGICVSSGPACSTGSSTPSHVLTAMGVEPQVATGSLRVSLGWGTTDADVERLLSVLPKTVERLRSVAVA
jgi:cysteine desulfurase